MWQYKLYQLFFETLHSKWTIYDGQNVIIMQTATHLKYKPAYCFNLHAMEWHLKNRRKLIIFQYVRPYIYINCTNAVPRRQGKYFLYTTIPSIHCPTNTYFFNSSADILRSNSHSNSIQYRKLNVTRYSFIYVNTPFTWFYPNTPRLKKTFIIMLLLNTFN